MNYRKPAFWIIVASVVICAAVAVCFLTNPSKLENFGETNPENLSQEQKALIEIYPEYFGLDASDGLDVYVWQMAGNSYSFGLMPHADPTLDYFSAELMNLRGASAADMRKILSSYDVDENEIYIIPWQHPFSSYLPGLWIIEEGEDPEMKAKEYIKKIRTMLFPLEPIDN